MTGFTAIDTETGREVSAGKIGEIARAKGLVETDIDQFYTGESGLLILMDDCGHVAYCDKEKLKIMPVLKGKYPDLEYLETVLLKGLRILHPEEFEKSFWQPQAELVDMFPQTWTNTAGGFSEPGMMSGRAFTTQYTTVMRVYMSVAKKEYYGVFFDNKPAYLVDNANELFFDDLKEHRLRGRDKARELYGFPERGIV